MSIEVHCPGCGKTQRLNVYKVCERCGTPHCPTCGMTCKAHGCNSVKMRKVTT